MGAAYKSWWKLLNEVLADDPFTNEWYMIRVGEYDRTAFMTRAQAIVYIKAQYYNALREFNSCNSKV